MIIGVTGGRDYDDRARVFQILDHYHAEFGIKLVVHGACNDPAQESALRGADRWAEEWAKAREVPYLGYPAPWAYRGKAAGPWRNGQMAVGGNDGTVPPLFPVPERWLVFPGGRGTADMKCKAAAVGAGVDEV